LFDQLGFAGLDGKVGLGKGDLLLLRITVLGDEVAGVAVSMMSGTSFSAPFGMAIVLPTSAKC
jgi:hypothetical protein